MPFVGGGRRLFGKLRRLVPLCLALFCLPAAAEAGFLDGYQLGEGLRLPNTGFTLGGYGSASYDHLRREPTRASLDDLSLFVWWEGEGRWKFFSELDFENTFSTHPTTRYGERRYIALERLYFDYALNDSTTLRIGKFLTPIGHWNLIHATPLVWTTSRPLITERAFPTNATGLMVNGRLPVTGRDIEYSLYASGGGDLRPNPDLDPFNEAIGAHLGAPLGAEGQIGFSYANFDQRGTKDETKQLVGLDFIWTHRRYEISVEGIYRFSDDGSSRDAKGAFVQLVAPLSDKLYAVGRFETYREAGETATTELWTTGLNYRLKPTIVFKAEWVGSRRNRIAAPEGFLSSANILF